MNIFSLFSLQKIRWPARASISSGVILLLAFTCGSIAVGSYLAQPILPVIGEALSLGKWAGFAVSIAQIGFCIGLIFIAPLGDLVENRFLVIFILTGSVLALSAAALAKTAFIFLASCFLIGLCSTSVQILIPMAAYLVSSEERGRVVGGITSGLLFGIMLARPVSSFFTYMFGWRVMYIIVAICVLSFTLLLFCFLPKRKPQSNTTYGELIMSLGNIIKETPELFSLAVCQALLFCAFTLFWTAAPFELMLHYGYNQLDVGLFALVGAGGAISSLLAGRIKNNKKQVSVRVLAIFLTIVAFIFLSKSNSILVMILAAIVIDAGVQFNHVLTQRAVVAISPTKVSRLNCLYTTSLFIGGAIGSMNAIWIFYSFGWGVVARVGLFLSICSFVIWILYINKEKLLKKFYSSFCRIKNDKTTNLRGR